MSLQVSRSERIKLREKWSRCADARTGPAHPPYWYWMASSEMLRAATWTSTTSPSAGADGVTVTVTSIPPDEAMARAVRGGAAEALLLTGAGFGSFPVHPWREGQKLNARAVHTMGRTFTRHRTRSRSTEVRASGARHAPVTG